MEHGVCGTSYCSTSNHEAAEQGEGNSLVARKNGQMDIATVWEIVKTE